jgi:hypothetical protein
VALRARIRKLEREAEEETIAIPQPDGTLACFPAREGIEFFMNYIDWLRGIMFSWLPSASWCQ